MYIRNHLLLCTLLPLSVIAIALSWYRFVATENYTVQYEADCDPATQQCFQGYDEESNETYYYVKVRKLASQVAAACGPDVTGCASASACLPTDTGCSVSYCSAETVSKDESCEYVDAEEPDESPAVPEDDQPATTTP
jgi:hypothetical protein